MIDLVSKSIDKASIVLDNDTLYTYNLKSFHGWKSLVELVTRLDFVLHSSGDCAQTIDMPFSKQREEFMVVSKNDNILNIALHSRHVTDPKFIICKTYTIEMKYADDIEEEILRLKKLLIPAIFNKEDNEYDGTSNE